MHLNSAIPSSSMTAVIPLLLIEDEPSIRDMLRFALPKTEFTLHYAEDIASAKKELASLRPDLILLDWMLPDQSGIAFLQWLRKQPLLKDLPVMMLTARAAEMDKVKGLSSGADDYITKPFSPIELMARIRAILRRGALLAPNDQIQHGDLQLNLQTSTLSIHQHKLDLSPIEFKLLSFFLTHPNRTYSRDQLLSLIWGNESDLNDRTVDVAIRRVRDKLKDHGYAHMISTIRGLGYQCVM